MAICHVPLLEIKKTAQHIIMSISNKELTRTLFNILYALVITNDVEW